MDNVQIANKLKEKISKLERYSELSIQLLPGGEANVLDGDFTVATVAGNERQDRCVTVYVKAPHFCSEPDYIRTRITSLRQNSVASMVRKSVERLDKMLVEEDERPGKMEAEREFRKATYILGRFDDAMKVSPNKTETKVQITLPSLSEMGDPREVRDALREIEAIVRRLSKKS